MTDPDYSRALEIELQEDPMVRFLAAMTEDTRRLYEGALVMRRTFEENACRLLTGNHEEAMAAAAWMQKRAGEVAYRYSRLREHLAWWMARDTPPLSILVSK